MREKFHDFLKIAVALTLMGALSLFPLQAAPKKKKGIQIASSSFQDSGAIPKKFTCFGENHSPELNWKNVPAKTKYFAIICEDPASSNGIWVHWLIYNIPAQVDKTNNTYQLLEGFPKTEKTRVGILQGTNDFKKIGYDGPCDSTGLHQFFFRIYALDAPLTLPAGAFKSQILKAMKGHILGWSQFMGTYGK